MIAHNLQFSLTLLVTWVLVPGVRESARTNNTMVAIKIGAILIFCLGAAGAIHPGNWHPFAPHGFSGILTGASIVFFTYIGFDSYRPPRRSAAARSAIYPSASSPPWPFARSFTARYPWCSPGSRITRR